MLLLLFLELLSVETHAQKLVFDSTYHNNVQYKYSSINGCYLINDSSFVAYGKIEDWFDPSPPRQMQKYDFNTFELDEFFRLPTPISDGEIFKCIIYNDTIYFEGTQISKVSLITRNPDFSFYNNLQSPENCLNGYVLGNSQQIFIKETGKYLGGEAEGIVPGSDTVRPGGFYLYSINPNGTFDSTFHHNTNDRIFQVTKGIDSTYFITGVFSQYDDQVRHRMVKIDCYGNLLSSQTPFASNSYTPLVQHVDPDGKVLIIGAIILNEYPNDTVCIVRLNPDLTLDTTFQFLNFPYQFSAQGIKTIQRIEDGYLVGGHFFDFFGHERSGIARIKLNGDIDTVEFNHSGFEHAAWPGLDPFVNKIEVLKDYVYVSGFFDIYNGKTVPPIIRFKMVPHDTTDQPEPPAPVFSEFQVYPSPSTGNFTIEFNQEANDQFELTVYDVKGKVVLENNYLQNKGIVNLSHLSSGIYFFRHHEQVIRVLKTN